MSNDKSCESAAENKKTKNMQDTIEQLKGSAKPKEQGGFTPMLGSLFHVTTGRKAKLYRKTGKINSPVRGFDSLLGAMAWAMKTGRKVILKIEPISPPQMLPDHHNEYGRAWWTESVPMSRVKCAYSAEGAWAKPETGNGRDQRPGPRDA